MRKKIAIVLILIIFIMTIGFNDSTNLTTVHAATTTITVKKSDESTAKKIDNQLKKGRAVQLKVKGNKTSSKNLLLKIQNQVGEVNSCDVKFQCTASRSSGKYYIYSVSSENAKLYKYSVQFLKKLYKNTRKEILENHKEMLTDEKTYPNEEERTMHIIYDVLVEDILESAERGNDVVSGYDLPTTLTRVRASYSSRTLVIKNESYSDGYEYKIYELRTYAEFTEYIQNEYGIEELLSGYNGPEIKQQDRIIIEKEKFSALSDAMKIYAISKSHYFDGNSPADYGMEYTYRKKDPTTTKGSKGMKHLYKGTARGVCHHFALYECLLWEQLGIPSYYNSYSKWNHAWSVVKVKNSQGKAMWVPFDYYIVDGYAYEIYMDGIKGAPKKQKWKMSDFN